MNDRADDRRLLVRLLDLAAPVIGLNVLSVLALAVDTAMCGRLPDSEVALTGLGFAVQIAFLLMVAMFGLMIGAVAMVSRAYGAGDTERLQHVVEQATIFTTAVAITMSVLGNAGAGGILWALGASDEAADAALLYLRPTLLGTVFTYGNMLYGSVLRGVGNTRLPFYVMAGVNGLNVLFNYALILGNFGFPALGLTGAALGTIAAQACGMATMAWLLARGAQEGIGFPIAFVKPDWGLGRTLFRVGAPAALDMVILNAGFLSIVGMLGRVDQVAVAAHGVGLRVQALAFVPGMSISQATAAMVGQALGAGDADEARAVTRTALVLCSGIMSTLGAAIFLGAYPLVGLFDIARDSELARYSVMWMSLLAYSFPVVGFYIALVGMLQGSGNTNTSLAINAVATLLVAIPLSAFLGFGMDWGVWGIWAGFPLSFIVKAALGWWVFADGRWARVGAAV